MINTLPAWAVSQGYGSNFLSVVDLFSLFGGHSIDTDDFQTTNIHPSEKGQYKIGKALGEKQVALLVESGGTGTNQIISNNIIS
jgi:hypothetical protein